MENENKNVDEKSVEVVNDDVLTSKNKSGIYIVVGLLILIVTGIILFMIFLKTDNKKKPENINNNNNSDNNVEVPTFSDDVIVDDSIEVENKIIYIYQKGYADRGPIAYTYECESESCDLKITEKGFILYDEDVVKYREMTTYEYEQIYNSDVSPVGGKLDMVGFEEVKSVYNGDVDEEITFASSSLGKLYIIDNILYKFGDSENKIEKYMLIDDEVLLCRAELGFLYNYKEKKIISWGEAGFVDCKKIDDFYLVYFVEGDGSGYYVVYNSSEKIGEYLTLSNSDGYYIYDNKLYYLDSDGKVQIINNKNEKFNYNNDGIKPIYIFEDKLMYLDNDNFLNFKNLMDEDNNYNTGIKLKNASIIYYDENVFEIYEYDETILDNSDFDAFREKQGLTKEQINLVRICLNDRDRCGLYDYVLGYKVVVDKNGELISKNYYVEVYD